MNLKLKLLHGCMILMIVALGWIASPALAEDNGTALFETHCSGCHLNGGNIIRRGKNLKLKTLEKNGYGTTEAIAEIITQGKNNMSAFSDRLSPSEIEQLSVYVLDQANRGWS